MTNLKTVVTEVKLSEGLAKRTATPKQISWLKVAEKNYAITVDLSKIKTIGQASALITKIQLAINEGTVTKRFFQSTDKGLEVVFYAVVEIDSSVFIKSFLGTNMTAPAKAVRQYGEKMLHITANIEHAKEFARELVAKRANESKPLDFTGLTVKELQAIALDLNVDLKGCKTKPLILAKLYKAIT